MRRWAMDEKTILIAGGGIAGLASALALARESLPAKLFEQAPAFEEVGAGLQMSPNAVRALQRLGAWEAVAPACVIPDEIHVRDGLTGAILQRVRLGKTFEQQFGAPYRVAHRADLLGGLLATARQSPLIALATSSRIVSAANRNDGVSVALAAGTEQTGAALIAADGIRSTIRAALIGDGDPVDRAHVIYRALIPLDKVPSSIVPDAVTLWLYPGGHVVHYPVSNWRQFNVMAAVDGTLSNTSWSEPGSVTDLKQRFSEAAEPLYELLDAPRAWLKWAAADRNPITRWSDGAIALIGDAAHATLPYLAQGAAMSLEDACVLGSCLKAARDIPAALTNYANLRSARTARIQRESLKLGRLYHATGTTRQFRNAGLRLMPQSRFLGRLAWIYRWLP